VEKERAEKKIGFEIALMFLNVWGEKETRSRVFNFESGEIKKNCCGLGAF
jgi:hypothetical protein